MRDWHTRAKRCLCNSALFPLPLVGKRKNSLLYEMLKGMSYYSPIPKHSVSITSIRALHGQAKGKANLGTRICFRGTYLKISHRFISGDQYQDVDDNWETGSWFLLWGSGLVLFNPL